MIKITGTNDKYAPIKKIGDSLYLISWNKKPLVTIEHDDNGNEIETTSENVSTWMQEMVRFKPSLEYIRNLIVGWYNEEIDNQILSWFKWNNLSVWLSTENQFNYKAAYDLAVQTNGANLPIIFKFGTTTDPVYHTFTSVTELNDFYISAIKYVNDTLAEGWVKKDSIDWEQYKIE